MPCQFQNFRAHSEIHSSIVRRPGVHAILLAYLCACVPAYSQWKVCIAWSLRQGTWAKWRHRRRKIFELYLSIFSHRNAEQRLGATRHGSGHWAMSYPFLSDSSTPHGILSLFGDAHALMWHNIVANDSDT